MYCTVILLKMNAFDTVIHVGCAMILVLDLSVRLRKIKSGPVPLHVTNGPLEEKWRTVRHSLACECTACTDPVKERVPLAAG